MGLVAGASGYRLLGVVIVAAFSFAALTGFAALVVYDPAAGLAERVPGEDQRPAGLAALPSVDIRGRFEAFDGVPSAITASWPRFRGISFDNTSREAVRLVAPALDWQPHVLWHVDDLGEGYAGAAVANGRVYVLDYDEARRADSLRCFSLDSGREIWRRWYAVPMKRNHGFSRTVPAVSGTYVVTIGPSCHVMCCDALSGAFRWGIDLAQDFGAGVPDWYAGQCPLIDGSEAVIAIGGPSTLLAGFDLASGRLAWQTPNPRGLALSHSSIMVATIGGVRTYVYAAIGGIVGISAEPSSRGTLLWESPAFDATVIAPSPVVLDGGRLFLTTCYGAGSIMLRVTRSGSSFTPEVLCRYGPGDGLVCDHQTPVLFRGMLIGVLPRDAGTLRAELACWNPDTRRYAWTSGQDQRFGSLGLGPYMIADGKLIILNEDGVLTIAEASTTAYRPLASARILDGPDAWAPMALAAGRLIARDAHRMVCVDLGTEG